MLKERMAKQLLDKEHGKKKRHKPSHRPKEDVSDLAATEALKALDEADSYSMPSGIPKPTPSSGNQIGQQGSLEGQHGSTDSSSNSHNEQNIIEETENNKLPTPPTDDLETDDAIAGMEEDFNPAPAPQVPTQTAIPKPMAATQEQSVSSRPSIEPKTESKIIQPTFQATPVSVVQNNIPTPKSAPDVAAPRSTTPYNPRKRWQHVKTNEPTPIPISTPVVQQPAQPVSVVQSNQNHIPQAKQPKLDLNPEPAIIMPSTVPAPVKQRPSSTSIQPQPAAQQQQQATSQSTTIGGIQPAEFSDEERLKIDEGPKIETTPKIATGHPKKIRRPSLPSTSPKVSPKVVNPEQQRRLSVSSEGSTQSGNTKMVPSGDMKNQRPVIINPPGHATRKLSSVSDGTDSPSIKLPSRGPSSVYKQPGVIQTPPPKMVVPLQSTQHVTPTNASKPSMAVRTNTPSQPSRMIISPNPNVSPNVIQIVPTGGIPGQSIITGNDGQSRLTHGQPTISRVIHQNPTQTQAQKIGQSTQPGQPAHPTGYIIGTQPYRLATTSGCIVQPSQNIIQVANPTGGYQQRVLIKQPNQSPTAKTGQGIYPFFIFFSIFIFQLL